MTVTKRCGPGHITVHSKRRALALQKCTYCRKSDHDESECYTKRRDDEDKNKIAGSSHIQSSLSEGAMACKEVVAVRQPDCIKKDVTSTTRTAEVEPLWKKSRTEGDPIIMDRSMGAVSPRIWTRKKNKAKSKRATKKRSTLDAHGNNAERFDFQKLLAQGPYDQALGQFDRGDRDSLRAYMRRIMTERVQNKIRNVSSDSIPVEISLYRQHGFVPVGMIPQPFTGPS